MLLLLVPLLDALAQLIQALAVLQLDLGAAPEAVLQLLNDGHLSLYSQVQASQLLVQLLADVYREQRICTYIALGGGEKRKCSLVVAQNAIDDDGG